MTEAKKAKKTSTQFLKTTLQLIEENHPSEAARWADDGKSFIIENLEKFLKVLPQYFKTKNYSSFVRQLNMYDFHKVKNSQGYHEFRHACFVRGHPELLDSIKRKIYDLTNDKSEFWDARLISIEKNRLEEKFSDLSDMMNTLRGQNISLKASYIDIFKHFENFKKSHDTKISKVFFQFLTMIQTYRPSNFDENHKFFQGKELQNIEKYASSLMADLPPSSPPRVGEDSFMGEKEKIGIYSLPADQGSPYFPNFLKQSLNPMLMITNKESPSSNVFENLKIDSFPSSPHPEFSKEDRLFSDNFSLSSVKMENFSKHQEPFLMSPDFRDQSM